MALSLFRMTEILNLKDQQPIAQGRMRYVYAHPYDPDLIIKTIRPEVINQRWGEGQPWYKAKRRHGHYISYLREIDEYIATYSSHGGCPAFTQKIHGLVETNLGLGLVLGAVRAPDGALAPTLTTLLREGLFDDEASTALESFFAQLVDSDVIIADLNGGNLVYTWSEEAGNHFVMIDGLGLATIMPFKAISRAVNRRSKLKRIERLRLRMKRDAKKS